MSRAAPRTLTKSASVPKNFGSSLSLKKPLANAIDNVDAKIPQKSTWFEKTFIGGAILGTLGALAFPIYSIVKGEQSKNDSRNDVIEIQDFMKKRMPVISSLSSCSCMCIMFVLVLVMFM